MSGAYGGLTDEEIEQRQIEAALETGANQQVVEGQMLNDAIQRLLASQAQFNLAAAESALLARTTNPAATAAVNEAIEAVRTAEAAANQGQDETAEEAVRAAEEAAKAVAANASSESMDVFLQAVSPIAGATTALLVSIAVAGAFSTRMDDNIKYQLMESPILFALYLFIKNYISINSAIFQGLVRTTLQQCGRSATPTELMTILLTTAYILKFGFSGLQHGIRTAEFTYSSGGLSLISDFVGYLRNTGANYLALGLQTVNTAFTSCRKAVGSVVGKRGRQQIIEGSYGDTGVTASYLSGLRGTPDVVQGLTAQTGDYELHPSVTDLQAKAYGYLEKLKREPVSTAPIVGDAELQEQRNRDRLRRFIRESNVGLPTGANRPSSQIPSTSLLSSIRSTQANPGAVVPTYTSTATGSNIGGPSLINNTQLQPYSQRAVVPRPTSTANGFSGFLRNLGLGGKNSTRKYKRGKSKSKNKKTKAKAKKAPKKTRKHKRRANKRKSKKH